MSMSVNNTVKENSISFDNESLISNSDNWKRKRGTVIFGRNIKLSANSSCELVKTFSESYKCNNLKLLCHLTCNDKTLSSENYHNVSMYCLVDYTDKDGNTNSIGYSYFPTYDFEDIYKNDYDIFNVPNSTINKVTITITNNEDTDVKVTNTGLFVSKVVDEDTFKDYVQSDDFKNYINGLVGDNTGSGGCTGCGIYRPIFDIYGDLANVEYRQEHDGAFPNGYAFILLKTQEERRY